MTVIVVVVAGLVLPHLLAELRGVQSARAARRRTIEAHRAGVRVGRWQILAVLTVLFLLAQAR